MHRIVKQRISVDAFSPYHFFVVRVIVNVERKI